MPDAHVRKLNSSIAVAAIVAAVAIGGSSGAACYYLGVHHAERRAAVAIKAIETESLSKLQSARVNLAQCEEACKQLEVAKYKSEVYYKEQLVDALERVEQFARKADELEHRLIHNRR